VLAVLLAFVALVAVRAGWRAAPALVWLFTLEGLADFINATAQGLRFNIAAPYQLGMAWLLPTYGIPAFTVAQVMVIALLLNRSNGKRPHDQRAGDGGVPAIAAADRLTTSLS
jgi:urea transporter